MKGYQHNILNSLAFRTVVPVIVIILLIGLFLYIFVLRSVSDFADTQIKEAFGERAWDIYQICDNSLNELIKSGSAGDEKAVRIKKALTIGAIEDFLNQNNISGIISDGDKEMLFYFRIQPSISEAISKKKTLNVVIPLEYSGMKYYAYQMHFDPWNWHIALFKDTAEYSVLIKRVKLAYVLTGISLLAAALMLIYYLNDTIKRPINKIILPLMKGEAPDYTGKIREFEFISENIGMMMKTLKEKTLWINQIYQIAATKRGVDFFDEIAVAIGKMFNMNSLIAKINPDSETATVFALYNNGKIQKDMSITLKNTPCEGVMARKQMVVINEGAYRQFSLADSLNLSKADSYIGFPVFDRKGDVAGIVNVFGDRRDFSETDINMLQTVGQIVAVELEMLEKQAEQDKLIKQVIQEQKLESIGLLAGGIAHNFNNMLVGVLGYASLIRIKLEEAKSKKQPPQEIFLDEILKYIDTIELSAQRASTLSRELASLAKGRPSDTKSGLPVNINKIMADLRKLILNTFPKNIETVFELPDNLHFVKGDHSQIEQAVLNICLNGKDAMPDGGHLTIKASNSSIASTDPRFPYVMPGNYVTISISDTGAGMDEKRLNRIFEPFFTTKPVDKGIGLGLSIAYAIIKEHSGYIIAESSPAAGATFTVHLPEIRA